jgi:hypothetical protein
VTLTERLVALIRAAGPLRFSAFMEAALYDEAAGFWFSEHRSCHGDLFRGPLDHRPCKKSVGFFRGSGRFIGRYQMHR